MARKIISIIVAIVVLFCCSATVGQCATYDVYQNGTISSTYITYFKDIISGESILSDYVAFRSGQYDYILAVGNIDYQGSFVGNGDITIYRFNTEGSYNNSLNYMVSTDSNFKLNNTSTVIYSNLGQFPQLIERGANFEVISTILICVFMCSVVIDRIFYYRKR